MADEHLCPNCSHLCAGGPHVALASITAWQAAGNSLFPAGSLPFCVKKEVVYFFGCWQRAIVSIVHLPLSCAVHYCHKSSSARFLCPVVSIHRQQSFPPRSLMNSAPLLCCCCCWLRSGRAQRRWFIENWTRTLEPLRWKFNSLPFVMW
jgi:hypothetical protein